MRWLGAFTAWKFIVAAAGIALGALAGIGAFTFVYASGSAYLTDDPAACVNCHVMRPQFDGWVRSSHHAVATCNDCHAPAGFLDRYVVKARNGWHHSFAFTTDDFHEPIRITAYNAEVTEAQCRRCHGELVEPIDAVGRTPGDDDGPEPDQAVSCIRCHGSVGHAHAR